LIFLLWGCAPYNPIHPASEYVGLHEIQDKMVLEDMLNVDPTTTPWCGAFVAYILEQQGMPIPKHPLWSRSYLEWGIEVAEPRYGDLVVFKSQDSTWQGHVGFYIADLGNDMLVLGGNQSDQVKYSRYSKSLLLGIRRFSSDRFLPPVFNLMLD
jgi:uncharacterized protein (TIGR02594 family)